MSKTVLQPIDLSIAVRDTFLVLRRAGPLFLVAAVLVVLPGTMAGNWVRTHPVFPTGLAAIFLQPALNFAAQLTPTGLHLAATAWVTARILDGDRVEPSDFARAILTRGFPVVAVQVISGLAVMAGSFLLLVPGLMLLSAWAFAPQVMAVEGGGLPEAFRRSAAITKGRRWMVFGLMVAFLAPVVILNCLLFKLSTGFGLSLVMATREPINLYGVAPVMGALVAVPSAVAMTALYCLFSDAKTSRADVTAEVFA
ncbi:hypothetical protein BH10PSE4_BH10PSE4_06480 [soil metagenome]